MRNVVMEKDRLMTALVNNRKGHRDSYVEARTIFRAKVIENLTSMLDRAKNGDKIELWVGLPEPEDHTNDYDRALAMLNDDVRDEIELSQAEYAQFVQDDWGWKQSFTANTMSYINQNNTQ